MKSITLFCFLFITVTCAIAAQPAQIGKLLSKQLPILKDNDQTTVLIYFSDKGNPIKMRSSTAVSLISERSINRRMRVRGDENIIDSLDYPLEPKYVQEVSKQVIKVRHELKWFNAVSVVATKKQIESLRNLPYVKEIELVGRWKKIVGDEEEQNIKGVETSRAASGTTSLDYGTSFTQVNQINIPKVHDKGIYGQGVVVGVFDNGFRLLTHEAFASMHIIAQHDFVDHKESVVPNNPNTGFGSHGVNTLSTIGGYKSGQLIGPAFKADYILARTENDSSETPIEEDNWAKAIEWADSIGVDITSTSLGYLGYDAPYPSWTWLDMNGNTTLITKAADRAVGLGIVVVNSAGNSGYNPSHNTLIAPADGDSVITAGAVDASGNRTSFSSIGPTTDIPPRIKPDIMAMGAGVKVASSTNITGYGSAAGTSFSCPLSAGVAALIRCANPNLTPMQVREAMRQTASNAATPDNLMGWGILNTDSAIKYYGALAMGSISGMKFNDLNGDGVKDAGEPPIVGAKVYLSGTIAESTYTDAQGRFIFNSLAIGNYTISAEIPSGWLQTLPSTPYTVNLLHKIDTSGFTFGAFQLGTIHGTAFNDTNHNGTLDLGEHRLTQWVFTLTGPTSYRTVSDSLGNFTFTNLGQGIYTLSESLQVGWFQTVPINPNTYIINMRSGYDTAGLMFGNYYFPDTEICLGGGWNLSSFPYRIPDNRESAIFPSAVSSIFTFSLGYKDQDTIPLGIGFWIKFDSAQCFSIKGIPILIDTINVKAGWNIIGSLAVPIPTSSIIESIPGMIRSPYFGYAGGYITTTSLLPFRGYFVKASSNGQLILNGVGK